jgi:hypothetical protein
VSNVKKGHANPADAGGTRPKKRIIVMTPPYKKKSQLIFEV